MSDPRGRHALVLAAGAGRRFGGGKLTALWNGEPLIAAAVRTALAATVERVSVVTGADGEAVARALSPFDGPRLTLAPAPDWAEGMAASLRAGIAALPDDARSAVVFLGDMPRIPPGLADRLLDALEAGAPAARVRSALGPAHPVAFAAALFPALLDLGGDRGARSVLTALGGAVAEIVCDDPGAVFDIDRRDDLAAR